MLCRSTDLRQRSRPTSRLVPAIVRNAVNAHSADTPAVPGDSDLGKRVVVVPYGGDKTRLADRLQLVAGVWGIALLIVAVRLRVGPLALVALGPIAFLLLPSSILRRLPGGSALVPASPYRVEFDRHGLTFGDPAEPPRQVRWEDIERMDTDRWCWGRLIARDGSLIGRVQPAYVRLQGPWFRAPSLAVYAVRMRPDLFVPSPSANRFTQPYGFERPSLGYRPPDLVAIERRQTVLLVLFVGSLVGLLAGMMVLFAN